MKRKHYSFFIATLAMLCFVPLGLSAHSSAMLTRSLQEDDYKTITMSEAGRLNEQLPREMRSGIVKLRIVGPMAHQDFWVLNTCSNLESLDLAMANITNNGKGVSNYLPDKAFDGHKKLREIILPLNLQGIGNYAFRSVKTLKDIKLPETVESLGSYAFHFCEGLDHLELPRSLRKFGSGTFTGCIALTSMQLPDGIEEITSGLFQNCTKLTQVHLPKSVVSIGYGAFSGSSITEIYLGPALKKIEKKAFHVLGKMSKIKSEALEAPEAHIEAFAPDVYEEAVLYVTDLARDSYQDHAVWSKFKHVEKLIPDETPSTSDLVEIDLTEAGTLKNKIPSDKVLKINRLKIKGLLNKEDFDYLRTFVALEYLDQSEARIVDDGKGVANRLPDAALRGLSKLREYKFPAAISVISSFALQATAIKSILLPSSITLLEPSAFAQLTLLEKMVINNGITTIPVSCFDGNVLLSQVVLPDSLLQIEANAFKGCSALSLLALPSTLSSIGENAFDGTSISQLVLGSDIKHIGNEAFKSVPLKDIVLKSSVPPAIELSSFDENVYTTATLQILKIAKKAIQAHDVWSKFKNIVIDESPVIDENGFVQIVLDKEGTFAEMLNYSVVKNATKMSISGVMNYYDFVGLKKVYNIVELDLRNVKIVAVEGNADQDGNLPYPADELPSNAFVGNARLKHIILPTSIHSIGMLAFGECSALEEIVIPENVTSIKYQAFFGCTSLKKATILHTLEQSGASIFSSCTSLQDVLLPSDLREIPRTMFYGCSALQQLTIPEKVISIANGAFEKTGIQKLTLPASLQKIEEEVFKDCQIEELTMMGEAPAVAMNSFNDWHYKNTVLKIKKSYVDSYFDDVVWSKFLSIIDGETGEQLAVDAVAPIRLYSTDESGNITLLSSVGYIEIYDMAGSCIYSVSRPSIGTRFILPKRGTYLLRIDNVARKIMIP